MQSYDWIEDLKTLSRTDLEMWAGEETTEKALEQKGQVTDVIGVGNNAALATVLGEDSNTTMVALTPDGDILWECTCSYWDSPCNHAVALLLVCIDAARDGQILPRAKTLDMRLTELEWYDPDETEDAWEESSEEWEGFEAIRIPPSFRSALEKMKKKDIIDLIVRAASSDEDLYHAVKDFMELDSGDPARITALLVKQIAEIVDGFEDLWDFGALSSEIITIQYTMEKLLEMGEADAVVREGMALWQAQESIIAMEDDDELSFLLEDCLAVFMEAALRSSMSSRDRLVWLIHKFLEDDYGLLVKCYPILDKEGFTQEDWAFAASAITDRMAAGAGESGKHGSADPYRTERLLDWLAQALEKSGAGGIEDALEQAAKASGEYDRLVEHYEVAGNLEKTRQWAICAFNEKKDSRPSSAWPMFNKLVSIAEKQKDFKQVAALMVEKFFFRPDMDSFQAIKEIAGKLNTWASVQQGLLAFLETGIPSQDLFGESGSRPLPEPWVTPPKNTNWQADFPYYRLLIQLLVLEERPDDALMAYRRYEKLGGQGPLDSGLFLAQALEDSHPRFAVEIFRPRAEAFINEKKSKSYMMAGKLLEKVKNAYRRLGEEEEWEAYHQDLYQQNKRKIRLVEVLQSL
ncbi:MAG: hypothetical protein JEZ02_00865 [Desulfatibacillum sp.]|nr:hypothetical protein [Desulfatibacillum sp.]